MPDARYPALGFAAFVPDAITGRRALARLALARYRKAAPIKADADTRAILKRKGFRWAPSQNA